MNIIYKSKQFKYKAFVKSLCDLYGLIKITTRHSLLTVILIVLISGITLAQQSGRVKLLFQISKETNDTSKAKLLITLGSVYYNDEPEQDRCFMEAYDLSKKNNFRYGLAYGQYYEGLLLLRLGKYDEAIEKYKRCIDKLDSIHVIQHLDGYPLWDIRLLFLKADKPVEKFRYYSEKLIFYKYYGPRQNTATCYHGIAGYYYGLADYDKALEYFIRARDVYQSFDPVACANEMQVIGYVYLEWGNLDKAEIYLKLALKEMISLNEFNDCFFAYHELGNLYYLRHDFKRALSYYIAGKKYATASPLQAINLVNCATVYLQLDSRDSALFCLDSAEKIRQKEKLGIDFPNGYLEIDYTLYKYYISTGDENRPQKSLEAALHEAQSDGGVQLVMKYTNELHSYLLKQGDSLQALHYLAQYQTIQDSLNKINTSARIATYEIEQQQRLKEAEIEQLQTQKTEQRNYYLVGGAFFLLIVFGVISHLLYRRKRNKEQLKTEFKKQLAKAETIAMRAQMNPHFIFNCLNSINSYVIDQKHETASDYLIKFSKLIRLILDNSRSETISINKELETLKLYVLLESARFDNKFTCVYNLAEDVNTNTVMIPPMLLQPFVENAIWHGLMQKESEGTITIDINKGDAEFLNISIIDDGIGREKAAEIKSKSATHKSHGLKVTSQRIEMMNKLNSTGAQVHIFDLKDNKGNAAGTKVELIIPI